jgi:hypothetical protein
MPQQELQLVLPPLLLRRLQLHLQHNLRRSLPLLRVTQLSPNK